MTQYKIEVTQPAVQDLQDILDYISNTLREPAAAQRIYTSIKAEILSLASMPERNRVVDDEPYAAMDVRRDSVPPASPASGRCSCGGPPGPGTLPSR